MKSNIYFFYLRKSFFPFCINLRGSTVGSFFHVLWVIVYCGSHNVVQNSLLPLQTTLVSTVSWHCPCVLTPIQQSQAACALQCSQSPLTGSFQQLLQGHYTDFPISIFTCMVNTLLFTDFKMLSLFSPKNCFINQHVAVLSGRTPNCLFCLKTL